MHNPLRQKKNAVCIWCHSNLFPEKVTQKVSLQKIANPVVISWLEKRLDKHPKTWALSLTGGSKRCSLLLSLLRWPLERVFLGVSKK